MDILDQKTESRIEKRKRRDKLIPFWMRVSCWFFMGFSILLPFVISFSVYKSNLFDSDYNYEKAYLIGFAILVVLMILSGVTGFAILRKKWWAINFGILYGVVAILVFGYSLFHAQYSIHLAVVELLLLFFLFHLLRMKPQWER